jgi:hypothetical protein
VSTPLLAPAGVLASAEPRLVQWRYHFTDARRGTLISTLPLRGVSLSEVLSGAADGTGEVPLADIVQRADPFSATIPRRCCVWAERREIDPATRLVAASDVLWGGIIKKRTRSLLGRSMKLDMVTWASYFQSRLVGDSYNVQRDKFTIFRALLAAACAQPLVDGADPGFYGDSPHTALLQPPLAPTNLSGVLADRTYLASDLKPVLEALTELSASGAGFDWRLAPVMRTPGDFTTLAVRLDLGYPRLGRTAPADLRWSTDTADGRSRWGYVSDLTITEDGSAVANRITAVGAGTGPDQIRAVADSTQTSRNEMLAGYPLYESSLNSSTSEDRTYDTVYGKAMGALLAGFAGETVLSGIKVRGDLAPTVTSYAPGDDLTVKVGEGLTGRPVIFVGQLTGRTIEPAEPGRTETVTLDVQGTVSG